MNVKSPEKLHPQFPSRVMKVLVRQESVETELFRLAWSRMPSDRFDIRGSGLLPVPQWLRTTEPSRIRWKIACMRSSSP